MHNPPMEPNLRLRVTPAIRACAMGCFALLMLTSLSHAATVATIDVAGARTEAEVIRQLLDTRVGAPFDPAIWNDDLQRLRNTELFYDVRGAVREDGDARHLTVHARNKFSLIPIFKYKQGGGTSLLTMGAYEVNLFDRLLEAGAQYENMDGNPGGVIWFRHPYLLSPDNHFGAELYVHTVGLPLLSLDGEEQAYFDNEERRFNMRLLHQWAPGMRFGMGFSLSTNDFLMDDSTVQRMQRNAAFLADHRLQSGRTVALLPRAVFGRIDRSEFHVQGSEWTLQAELAHRILGSEFDFARAEIRWLGAWLPARDWNLAAQAQLGTKTGHEAQHKFYLGGLDTLRGFLDGQFRGDHYWLVNAELRPTLWSAPRMVVQGNVFADLAKTWDEQRFSLNGFERPFVSTGAGLRIILPRIYRAVLRLDVARTLTPVRQTGIALGLQQFF